MYYVRMKTNVYVQYGRGMVAHRLAILPYSLTYSESAIIGCAVLPLMVPWPMQPRFLNYKKRFALRHRTTELMSLTPNPSKKGGIHVIFDILFAPLSLFVGCELDQD
ncbi:uncharacterized protein LOC110891679 [Helianthus annuus]|uniref:uncharacterized protein LOC110891679 n=1 Tax=Helianthus annuus TaxID=4232 RepID=UPI001652DC24|nr:uncharacterized protein LOC110891679 [Helianthus annuus]